MDGDVERSELGLIEEGIGVAVVVVWWDEADVAWAGVVAAVEVLVELTPPLFPECCFDNDVASL